MWQRGRNGGRKEVAVPSQEQNSEERDTLEDRAAKDAGD